mmetsp:Transcript_95931/g.151026  ORF Transcript_95931/g.151026 Transcript_95931/m.151026 type:complete len:181 (+) Transcript_95931:32-574(+)
MSLCRIESVKSLKDGARVSDDLEFEIVLDVAEDLSEDVVFSCCYVVDPASASSDLVLVDADVGDGPGLKRGMMKFVLESPPPPLTALQQSGIILSDGQPDVGGLYISAAYRGKEFCRIGYFIRLEYDDAELQQNPPQVVQWDRFTVALSKPTATLTPIKWDDRSGDEPASKRLCTEGEAG